ncbi:MAG: tRNA (adenosine(37)-N6)-threonylcarbamoyltransferase complex ATPase subunit type 1 TsaE, partial [Bacteroidales bacterium]|nr:tRNA (adenosine(37)-N6)-threonylcarbamoyltransferase complex ATPase subunit type 1 TsaE [Bacteroidales bacterium]
TDTVNSPTFTIVQVYEDGRIPFYHFDVYRIGDPEEMRMCSG